MSWLFCPPEEIAKNVWLPFIYHQSNDAAEVAENSLW